MKDTDTRAVYLPLRLFRIIQRIAMENRRSTPKQLAVIVEEWEKMLDKPSGQE